MMQLEQMFIDELLKYKLKYDDEIEDFFPVLSDSANSGKPQCEKIVGFTKRIGRLTLETLSVQGCDDNLMDEIYGILEDLGVRSKCIIKTNQYVGELFAEYKEDMLERGDYHGHFRFLAIFVRLNKMCLLRSLIHAVNAMNNFTRDILCENVSDPLTGFKNLDWYALELQM